MVAMVHLPPLPGSPRYRGSMSGIVETVGTDVAALVAARFDAVLYVNEGDAPFPVTAPQETVAAFAAVVAATCPASVPHGVEVLFDPEASLSVAAATGASFIRGSVIGAWEATSGLRLGGAASVLRRRRWLGLDHVGVFGVVQAELASPLSEMTLERRLQLAVAEKAVDVLLIGADPGQAAEFGLVEALRPFAGGLPMLANSGVRSSNVADVLTHFDGCLVGTDLRRNRSLDQPVDPERAEAVMAAVRVPS